jgi:type IV secretory pathway TrbD component
MRTVYDVSKINIPRTIAGIEWKLVVAVSIFFGMGALMFKAPLMLLGPVLLVLFLRWPGQRDPDFLKIYRRHAVQRDLYSPAYICAVNLRTPRPSGFSRLKVM